MKKQIENIIPVGAPWGGPESFKFLSCFASLCMHLEGEHSVSTLYCDRDDRVCTQCGECGEMVWERKCHEQIYHDYLTLSGVACMTLWPGAPAGLDRLCGPRGFTDDTYLRRTLDFAGYSYRLLEGASPAALKQAVVESISAGVPVLAAEVVSSDWCLVSGYEAEGEIISGFFVPEEWDEPALKPDWAEEGAFSKANWGHAGVRLLLINGRRPPRADYAEVFGFLARVLRQPGNAGATAGLAAYAACRASLLDEVAFRVAGEAELAQLYRLTHAFIGVLAEARCFAAFAFWAGFFGRVQSAETLARMKQIGELFMDTHNQCWGAWAAMGQDHQCRPELYLEKFRQTETRRKLVEYLGLFQANDEKAIAILKEISARRG